ncbi:molybdate ABC transporter permease subunit [Aestuariibacter sp. AA17]|uniref:Molybdenum transport system permease n=1 Tax=Fluctibacter corallii TaxID=2984329 RepID=A0ABT3A5S9_9ALTE|nr:molybdate ABC transporter permease subunit [Aestuariibacter sp. AA17]MCV2883914.1 molybdate ABC transporter permease subunit [Aestuariibacter sp. AA17]
MTPEDFDALWVTLKLALVSTSVLLVLGGALAYWLANTHSRLKTMVHLFVAMPLVLPPTVLGFYLLMLLSSTGPLAWFYHVTGLGALAFSFHGLVIGSCIYSLPFVVQPMVTAFRRIPQPIKEVAATLGAKPLRVFFTVQLPMVKDSVIAAAILGFAHTLGEFGVVLMIGGNIPGETRVASIAVYEHVESLNYASAHYLSGILIIIALAMLSALFLLNRNKIGLSSLSSSADRDSAV